MSTTVAPTAGAVKLPPSAQARVDELVRNAPPITNEFRARLATLLRY